MSKKSEITWDIDIKILSNKFIVKQIYMAFGIPCVILFLFVSILNISDGIESFYEYFESIKGILYISVGFLIIPIPIIFIFFKNRYPFTFLLDDKYAIMATRKEQRKKNSLMSNLLIFVGLLSAKPGIVGTGLINKNNNDVMINFSNIKQVRLFKKEKTIYLKGSFPEKLYLFCTEENYNYVLKYVKAKVKNIKIHE